VEVEQVVVPIVIDDVHERCLTCCRAFEYDLSLSPVDVLRVGQVIGDQCVNFGAHERDCQVDEDWHNDAGLDKRSKVQLFGYQCTVGREFVAADGRDCCEAV
jgi:hypothetical protein